MFCRVNARQHHIVYASPTCRHYWNRVAIHSFYRVPVVLGDFTDNTESCGTMFNPHHSPYFVSNENERMGMPSCKTRCWCNARQHQTVTQNHGGKGERTRSALPVSCCRYCYRCSTAVRVCLKLTAALLWGICVCLVFQRKTASHSAGMCQPNIPAALFRTPALTGNSAAIHSYCM